MTAGRREVGTRRHGRTFALLYGGFRQETARRAANLFACSKHFARLFSSSLAFAAVAVLTPTASIQSARADDIDDYIAGQREKQKIAGLSLAVVQDGKVVKEQGYGLASIELGVPATAANVYEIGSISKTFTATLVLKLVDEGKLNLDDPISRYIAGTPAAWAKITVRQLLNQTSGIRSYTSIPAFVQAMTRIRSRAPR